MRLKLACSNNAMMDNSDVRLWASEREGATLASTTANQSLLSTSTPCLLARYPIRQKRYASMIALVQT